MNTHFYSKNCATIHVTVSPVTFVNNRLTVTLSLDIKSISNDTYRMDISADVPTCLPIELSRLSRQSVRPSPHNLSKLPTLLT